MKKRQVIPLGLVAAMSMGLLAGCGSEGKKADAGKGEGKDDVVTLKWIQVGNGMPKNYDEWLKQINPWKKKSV